MGRPMVSVLSRAATGKASDAKMSLGEKMAAGAFSALPATALMAPVERIKCLLQIQGEEVGSKVWRTVSIRCMRCDLRGWDADDPGFWVLLTLQKPRVGG